MLPRQSHRVSGCVPINSTGTRPEERRRKRRPSRRHFDCCRRRRWRAKGLRTCISCRGRRDHCARTRQRAAERSLSRGIRATREPAQKARRRCRGARRQGDDEARHGRLARRRAGLHAAWPHRDHALERWQEGRSTRCFRWQRRLLRYRRYFHQGCRQHGGHEGRHGRGGLRGRPDARAGRAQGQGQCGRRHRSGREHARR